MHVRYMADIVLKVFKDFGKPLNMILSYIHVTKVRHEVINMKYPYSFGSAVGYSLVLLVSLWWLPVLGPILIGYITGRKAGDPVKGLVAMAVPIALYFMIVQFIAIGWVHVPHIVQSYFSTSLAGAAAGQVFVPYVKQTYITGMEIGTNLLSYLYYAPSAFFIMLTFAFIGGAMSKQVIMERGIYPERKSHRMRRKVNIPEEVPKKPVIKKAPVKSKNTTKKVKNLDRDGKFVVHKMDTKKTVPVKKKYGITFL